jgi:transcriptional regulator with XRE-family HTH domain
MDTFSSASSSVDFHEKLRRLTLDHNRAAVCRRAGLSENSIHRILARKQTPRADVAARIARALGVDPGWLIDDNRGWPPGLLLDEVGSSAA